MLNSLVRKPIVVNENLKKNQLWLKVRGIAMSYAKIIPDIYISKTNSSAMIPDKEGIAVVGIQIIITSLEEASINMLTLLERMRTISVSRGRKVLLVQLPSNCFGTTSLEEDECNIGRETSRETWVKLTMLVEQEDFVMFPINTPESLRLVINGFFKYRNSTSEALMARQEKVVDSETLLKRCISVFTSVPGITKNSVEYLLYKYGSIDQILQLGEAELLHINGMGPIRAHNLWTVLNTPLGYPINE